MAITMAAIPPTGNAIISEMQNNDIFTDYYNTFDILWISPKTLNN